MINGISMLAGVRILSNPLATKTEYRVVRHSSRKRRRNWRVEKRQVPTVYVMDTGLLGLGGGKTIVAHPSVYWQLMAAFAKGE